MSVQLRVSEVFASVQGEGVTVGTPSAFVRLLPGRLFPRTLSLALLLFPLVRERGLLLGRLVNGARRLLHGNRENPLTGRREARLAVEHIPNKTVNGGQASVARAHGVVAGRLQVIQKLPDPLRCQVFEVERINRSMCDLAQILREVESARGTTELKFQLASKVLSGRTFTRGTQPYQDFAALIQFPARPSPSARGRTC